jgi:molecular chaperone DnaK (HSP70)
MATLGLDLGTWSVKAIVVDETNALHQPVLNPVTGQPWTRSSIARGPSGGWLTGSAAESVRPIRPDLYRDDVKRLLQFDAPVFLGGAPYQVVELLAQIIRSCAGHAQDSTGQFIDRLILGYPAIFEGARAALLRRAAIEAGFHDGRIDLVPEPVAAARAAHDSPLDEGTWLIVDLGGGTLDLALVRTTRGTITVLDVDGDDTIGGFAIDAAIVDHLTAAFDLPCTDTEDQSELLAVAQEMQQLTGADIAYGRNPCRSGTRHLTLTRADLDTVVEPVLAAMIHRCLTLLERCEVSQSDLTAVIPSGTSTVSPGISCRLGSLGPLRRPAKAAVFGLINNDTPSPSENAADEAWSMEGSLSEFSPYGRHIAILSADRTRIGLWNLDPRNHIVDLSLPAKISRILFTPDGSAIAALHGRRTDTNRAGGTAWDRRTGRATHFEFPADGRLATLARTIPSKFGAP